MAQRRVRGEGSVFRSEAKGCWIWRAIVGHHEDGSVKYKQGRARTQAAALRKKQAAEQLGTQPHADRETVGDHLDHWLRDVARPTVRPNTWARYDQIVRIHLKPKFGGHPLRKLSVAQVTRGWAEMHDHPDEKKRVTAGTIKACAEVLATALECAVAEGKIPTAPTRAATKPAPKPRPVEVFTDAEVGRIMDAARGHRLEALFLLGIGSGAREGELLALELGDFNLVTGMVSVTKMLDQPKGGFQVHPPKSAQGVRTFDLADFVIHSLARHFAGREPGPVFTTSTGQYLRKSNFINRDWAGLLARAGVPYRRFHTLRHTHASRLLADGVDVAEVARRLGDRIETIHRSYAHWIPTTRATGKRLDRIYGTAPDGQGGVKVTDGQKGAEKGGGEPDVSG